MTPVQLAADKLKGTRATAPIAITFYGRSSRAQLGKDLWISVAMTVRPGKDQIDPKNWRTHTRRYDFSLFESEKGRTELLTYHFHPDTGVAWPHLHIDAKADWWTSGLRKSHIATGRMTIEAFVAFLIEEVKVPYTRSAWKRDLAKNLQVFGRRRTW